MRMRDRNARVTAFGDTPQIAPVLLRQHRRAVAAAVAAAGRWWQENTLSAVQVSTLDGQVESGSVNVRYLSIPVHSEHSRKGGTEERRIKNMMDCRQQRTIVQERTVFIKRICQKINNY